MSARCQIRLVEKHTMCHALSNPSVNGTTDFLCILCVQLYYECVCQWTNKSRVSENWHIDTCHTHIWTRICQTITFLSCGVYLFYVTGYVLFSLKPVSYTHLDVYKRQGHRLVVKYCKRKYFNVIWNYIWNYIKKIMPINFHPSWWSQIQSLLLK